MKWQQSVEELGYAVVPGVLQTNETKTLLEVLASAGLPAGRAGVRHALQIRAVSALAHDARLLEIVRAVLGDAALPFRATLFNKSSHANWLIAWHQDTALPLREKKEASGWGPWSVKEGVIYAHAPASALEQVVALRLHLDDSTEQNGPLRVLPRSHNLGVLSDEQVHALVKERPAACCLTDQGGAIIMRPLIIHASSKSVSSAERRVLHIEYATKPAFADGMQLALA